MRVGCADLNQVHLGEGLIVPRLLDVEDGDDVLVVEISQQLHLTQRPQTEHGVVEGCDLLDGDLLARRLVQRGAVSVSATALALGAMVRLPYYAVRAFTDHILDVVLLRYVEGYLPRAAASCGRHVCGLCKNGRWCAVRGVAVRCS
jgi:hypothetical protein